MSAEAIEVVGQGKRFPSGAGDHQGPVTRQNQRLPAGFFSNPHSVDELFVTVSQGRATHAALRYGRVMGGRVGRLGGNLVVVPVAAAGSHARAGFDSERTRTGPSRSAAPGLQSHRLQ